VASPLLSFIFDWFFGANSKGERAMEDINFFETFTYMIVVGAAFGLLFNFFKGESLRSCWSNVRMGIIGSSIGTIIALNLPIVAENRAIVVLAMATLVPSYVMIGNWMISKGTTPVTKAISDYRELPEDLAHQDREHENQPNRPAA
jgi:uncharacterized membrane protein YeaQ/YmgE (transglycosylase-associated protein family)